MSSTPTQGDSPAREDSTNDVGEPPSHRQDHVASETVDGEDDGQITSDKIDRDDLPLLDEADENGGAPIKETQQLGDSAGAQDDYLEEQAEDASSLPDDTPSIQV